MKKCECEPGHDVILFLNGMSVVWVCTNCAAAFDSEPQQCQNCDESGFERREERFPPICYCFTCRRHLIPTDESA